MRQIKSVDFRVAAAALASWAMAGGCLGASGLANAADGPDFSNPAVAISSDAVIASGTCIAKYAAILDDRSKPAAQIGQRVARRCAAVISRSAGLASWMAGRPDDFAKNLKYMREELTTQTVVRIRESKHDS